MSVFVMHPHYVILENVDMPDTHVYCCKSVIHQLKKLYLFSDAVKFYVYFVFCKLNSLRVGQEYANINSNDFNLYSDQKLFMVRLSFRGE